MIALDLHDPRWIEFVSSCSASGPFHQPAWSEVLAECYGYRAFALALVDGAGEITDGAPMIELAGRRGRRWVSLPFTDECQPLSGREGTSRLARELDLARREAGIEYVEIRGELDHDVPSVAIESGVRHTLDLSSNLDQILSHLTRSQAGRNIKRARREGVVVRRAEKRDDLTRVYYAMHVRTRRRLGAPAQPRRFFDLLWQRMLEPGLGFVLLAYAHDEPVAGAVFLAANGTIVYKFGASETSSWRLRPNHLVFWSAISIGCEQGFRELDFGRTELHHKGLLDFKRQWATREIPLSYTGLGARPAARRPLGLSGARERIIRRAPPALARLWGELFYKYAA